jgi:hypothetical protein
MAKLDPAPQKSENVISAEQHSDLIKLPACHGRNRMDANRAV